MLAPRPNTLARLAVSVPLSAALLWLGSQVVSLRNSVEATSAFMAAPTAVAVVDLGKVFDQLKSAATWQISLDQLTKNIKAEAEAKKSNLDRMRKDLEGITDDEKRSPIVDQIAMAQLELEEWGKLKQLELDREASLMWTNMYRAVRQEATKIAQASGYELVLVDDSHTEVTPSRNVNAPMEVQARQQISSLQVLYAAKTIDITDQVIVQINNKT